MLRVCIIGESGHYSHAVRAAAESDGLCIAAVSDGAERAGCDKVFASVCGINPDAKKYESYTEMLDKEKPDIAVVNPYCAYNAQTSIECMRRGIHVFSEKPAAVTLAELDDLKRAYSDSRAEFSTMMAIRYTPHFAAAKRAADSGAVGEIRLMNAQKSYRLGQRSGMYLDRRLCGGTIPWVGSHAIDWLYWFSGKKFLEVYAVQSSMANRGHNDLEVSAACCFKMENEVSAIVSIDFLRPESAPTHGDDRIRIVGSEGVLEVRGDAVYLINKNGEQTLQNAEPANIFSEFVKKIQGKENEAVSTEDAFYITEACLRARESADTGKAVRF